MEWKAGFEVTGGAQIPDAETSSLIDGENAPSVSLLTICMDRASEKVSSKAGVPRPRNPLPDVP
jgi:hypothetical protein